MAYRKRTYRKRAPRRAPRRRSSPRRRTYQKKSYGGYRKKSYGGYSQKTVEVNGLRVLVSGKAWSYYSKMAGLMIKAAVAKSGVRYEKKDYYANRKQLIQKMVASDCYGKMILEKNAETLSFVDKCIGHMKTTSGGSLLSTEHKVEGMLNSTLNAVPGGSAIMPEVKLAEKGVNALTHMIPHGHHASHMAVGSVAHMV